MPRGSPELVSAKLNYVKELVAADNSLLMYAVAKKVHEKFGESLAPDKLREAFLQSGGTIGRRGPKRIARQAEVANPANESPKVSSTAEMRKPGRRRTDTAAAHAAHALSQFAKHIVVVRANGASEVHEFASPDDARKFLSRKLEDGVQPGVLGFYAREPLQLVVGI